MHLRDWDTLSSNMRNASNIIPCNVGVGLRAQHYQEILKTLPKVGWFEAHRSIWS